MVDTRKHIFLDIRKTIKILNAQSSNSYFIKYFKYIVRERYGLVSQCIQNKTKITNNREFNVI